MKIILNKINVDKKTLKMELIQYFGSGRYMHHAKF